MSRNVVRKGIELNADTVEWFEQQYPDSSLTGIISMLFDKFKEVHSFTPKDYAEMAVKSLREDIRA